MDESGRPLFFALFGIQVGLGEDMRWEELETWSF